MIHEAEPGDTIYSFAIRMKDEMNTSFESNRYCKFNGIEIQIWSNSNVDDINTIYTLKRQLEKY